ncbi:MAG: hypothetical protein QOH08_1027 [Chloroflexota bacterium]|nr:hypothetical protein [Chloroflexota bacterium]
MAASEPVEPAPAIFAYTSKFSFAPGERVPIHVSCEQITRYTAQLVRLRHGYEGPESPGFLETELPSTANREHAGGFHPPNTGSYVTVPDAGILSALISWTIEFTFQATTPDKPLQYLLGAWDDSRHAGYAVALEDGRLALVFGDGEGARASFAADPQIEARSWYRVVATFDAATGDSTLRLDPTTESVNAHRLPGASHARGDAKRFRVPFPPAIAAVPFRIGAGSSGNVGVPEGVGHYNGKIGNVLVFPTAAPAADAMPLAAWDFARSERGDGSLLDAVVDVSGNGFHGVCVNSPTRAVTGHNWTGREPNFRHAPNEYGAIHFHDDDLDDARWPEAFDVDQPHELESGKNAVRLRAGETESHLPLVVRPGPGSKRNAVALLLPTGSYLAYANDRLQFDTAGTELLIGHTPVVSRHDLELQRHYDFGGSNYEVHSDGSGVVYSSRRRPIVTLDPRYRAWMGVNSFWQFPADLCIVDWLHAEQVAFDVITDEDLDREGVELLAPYRVVLTGSHPEYVSLPELDAMEAYVAGGGRVMYLGGNGFYWIVSYHPEKPHVMEIRRSESGTRPHQAPAGEYYLATNGELGALWRNKGRPPQRLFGVGFTAQGFDRSSPYLRMPDSFDARAAFIFEGVGDDEVIGDFGIVGGGAAGAEVDRYDLALGTPPDALLVATSTPLSDNYNHCSEEIFETPPGLRGSEDPDVRSDLVYFCHAGGGAVFSTGSIAWTGSLSHNGYDNNVARITGNVLRRFASGEPLDW